MKKISKIFFQVNVIILLIIITIYSIIFINNSVQSGDMSAVEGELSSGVSGAWLYGPVSELVLQMFWISLSQQTVKLLPLSDDLQDTWQMSLVSLYPPPDQPGSVKDTEEASANTSSLWPEGFHEAVTHHSQ